VRLRFLLVLISCHRAAADCCRAPGAGIDFR
jgi:hypothetical protein